jgi:transcriptional regulator with XRE-family HTH domain
MEQYHPTTLFVSLKAALKSRGVTYGEVAREVGCSESTIKHLFHGQDAPISRIIEICNAIGVSFPDLVNLSGDYVSHFTMTEEQERFFADNLNFYEFFRKVFFEGKSSREVKVEHGLDERSLRRYLRELDRIGILELQPGDRLVFKVHGMQQFIPGGPLMQRYLRDFSAELTEEVGRDMRRSDVSADFYRKRAHREFMVKRAVRQLPVSWFFGVVPQRLKCFYNSVIPRL